MHFLKLILFLLRSWIVLAFTALLAATGFAAEEHGGGHAPAAAGMMTEARQDLCSPTQAYEWLKSGNERFRAGKSSARDLVAERAHVSKGQYPYAAVLSCMDSRTSPEMVFDARLGDLFAVRLSGNVVNDDVLGSLEYALKVGGAKLLLVLGHSDCDAVKAAVDDKVVGNLTGLLARIRPAVTAIPDDGKPRTGKNEALVDRVSRMNVILTVRTIRDRSPILRDLQDRGQIDILGAFYDIKTGKVEFYRPMKPGGPIKETVHHEEETEETDAEAADPKSETHAAKPVEKAETPAAAHEAADHETAAEEGHESETHGNEDETAHADDHEAEKPEAHHGHH